MRGASRRASSWPQGATERSRSTRRRRTTCSASRHAVPSFGSARTKRAASPWASRRTTGRSGLRACRSATCRAPSRAPPTCEDRSRAARARTPPSAAARRGGMHDARRLRRGRGREPSHGGPHRFARVLPGSGRPLHRRRRRVGTRGNRLTPEETQKRLTRRGARASPHGTSRAARYDAPVRRALLSSTAAGILLLASLPAAANGRFPASNQLVFSPSDPKLMVLRTSYGTLPSHDNGASWGFICEDALGLGPQAVEDPSIGLTTNNSLILGVSVGLNVSTDVGCNWTCQQGPLLGARIVDIAVRPDNPASAVAITGTYVMTDAATDVTDSQVYETTDNGATWAAIGSAIDPTVVVKTIDVAKGDPNRLYVSGTRGFGSAKTATLYVSTDKGKDWTPHDLPPAQYDPSTEDSVYIGAIDPNDIDRVYIRSSGLTTGGRSRLTVVNGASSASPTFTTAHIFEVEAGFSGESTGELLGLALSADGSKVYVGTKEDGL